MVLSVCGASDSALWSHGFILHPVVSQVPLTAGWAGTLTLEGEQVVFVGLDPNFRVPRIHRNALRLYERLISSSRMPWRGILGSFEARSGEAICVCVCMCVTKNSATKWGKVIGLPQVGREK